MPEIEIDKELNSMYDQDVQTFGGEPETVEDVRQMPSAFFRFGNEPTSEVEESPERTYQNFAEGAGGGVFLYLKAREKLGDPEGVYLREAIRCGEEIWARGLVRNGIGLCCGLTGNVYALFALAAALKGAARDLWLTRARSFAAFTANCEEELPRPMRIPALRFARTEIDNFRETNSLMEGLSGVVLMLTDMEDPLKARYPLLQPTAWNNYAP